MTAARAAARARERRRRATAYCPGCQRAVVPPCDRCEPQSGLLDAALAVSRVPASQVGSGEGAAAGTRQGASSAASNGIAKRPPSSFAADHVAGVQAAREPTARELAREAKEGRIAFMPTPADIARECKAIRSRWSAKERASRRAFADAVPWFAPECNVVAGE